MSGSLAVYGGTFDPVHYGHLRSAIEIRQALRVDTMCLVPSYLPPHRQQPDSTPEQRLEMLRLAIDGHAELRIDNREIKRKGPSFMVETLESIRQDVGPDASLSLVLGSDAFAIFSEWRRWEDITEIAHLVVLERLHRIRLFNYYPIFWLFLYLWLARSAGFGLSFRFCYFWPLLDLGYALIFRVCAHELI